MPNFSERGFIPDEGNIGKKKKEIPFLYGLERVLPPQARTLLLLGLLWMGGEGAAQASDQKRTPGVSFDAKTEEQKQGKELEWPGTHFTFLEKSPNGQTYLKADWERFLFPLQLEVAMHEGENIKIQIELPFEYARLFNIDQSSGRILNEQDREKLRVFIENEIRSQRADNLYGLNMNKEVYRHHHGSKGYQDMEVVGMRVIGYTSPEGPEKKGSSTLKPDEEDIENVELGLKRADTAWDISVDEMEKLGIDASKMKDLREKLSNISAEEIQFKNPDEINSLIDIANKRNIQGVDELEKIFHLIVDYNNNKITDKDDLTLLDNIVASKRKVSIEVTLTDGKKDVLLIPIPLFLLLLGALPSFRRRRNEVQTPQSPEAESPSLPRDKTTLERPPLPVKEIPLKVRKTELPPSDSEEYKDMKDRTWADDLYVYYDDEKHRARGLDYRFLTEDIVNHYSDFKNDREREDYFTQAVLEAWKKNDREIGRGAGIQEERLESLLDYENQERQIQWARMHARAMIEVAKYVHEETEKGADDERDLHREALTKHTQEIIHRRVFESAQ